MVAPLFERQQAFNSAMVDHVNRNIATHRESRRAFESVLATIADDRRRFLEYQTLLVQHAAHLTLAQVQAELVVIDQDSEAVVVRRDVWVPPESRPQLP